MLVKFSIENLEGKQKLCNLFFSTVIGHVCQNTFIFVDHIPLGKSSKLIVTRNIVSNIL